MTKHQIASISFISACIALCAWSNQLGAYICLSVGLILFGFLMWLDRNKTDKLSDIELAIKNLKERVDIQSLRNR